MPSANNYYTIFELGLRTFPWVRIVQPLIFVAIGFLFIHLFKNKKYYLGVVVFITSIASIILLVSLVTFISNFLSLRSSYVSGKSMVIKGVVQDFRPAPMLGPARESFSVNGIAFSYNALDDTPCFHDAPIHHGPIREGLRVRIHYYESCIQRIEAE